MIDVTTDGDVRNVEAHRLLFLTDLPNVDTLSASDRDLLLSLLDRFDKDVGADVTERELYWLRRITK